MVDPTPDSPSAATDVKHLGLIAGKGDYPELVLSEARSHGVEQVTIAAFDGETSKELVDKADHADWMRVGQLGRLLKYFKAQGVTHALMAGQITPGRLFDLRPDFKALLLIAKLKQRNAETLFGGVADSLEEQGIQLLPATTFLEGHLAAQGHIAGPRPSKAFKADVDFGWPLAKQVSALDIGQTIVVKRGTVLAVEGFDGTNDTLRRGGKLGKGRSTVVKVSKPRQDMRFDVPVIGPQTLKVAAESNITGIVCEAKKTLLLNREELTQLAHSHGITLWGQSGEAPIEPS